MRRAALAGKRSTMGVQFTVGHVGGGTKNVDVPSEGVDAVLDSLLRELHDSDDEHYQGYVINSAGAGMTVFDSGLMSIDGGMGDSAPASRYHRPATHAEAVAVLRAFVHLRRDGFLPLFTLEEPPPPGTGPNFLIAGMGEFALTKAAWSRNFTRVKYLVEAGHDVNQRTPEGSAPLLAAVREGHAPMCRYLLEHGADVTVRSPEDGWGQGCWSLLRIAGRRVDGRWPEIVEMLRQAGAPE
jgi:hypothetical protein